MNDTSRRFPRTLLDAFPTHYPESIECYRKPLIPQWFKDALTAIALGCAGAELLILWLTS